MSYNTDLTAEKPAIVIDIGHAYTKCGFSGETGPHSIISSKVIYEMKKNQPLNVYDYKNLIKRIGDESLKDFNKKEKNILRELLIEFLYRIYYKILNANARERKVIIIESILTPSFFRKTLADVLFNNFQAVSVMFLPSHLAALYTLGINKGLVLDCGYADCQIMPISESVPMTGQCNFMNLGGNKIHTELERLLKNHAFITENGKKMKFCEAKTGIILNEETFEDIKLRCCFITTLERSREFWSEIDTIDTLVDKNLSDLKFKFCPDCDYNLYDNIILHVPGYLREMALEMLFIDQIDTNQTIPHLIIETLVDCPIDLKKVLGENVVLMGGTCMLEGFKSRLVSELNFLLNDKDSESKLAFKEFKYHIPPALDNYTAWLGGAIFGHLEILDAYSISQSKYKEYVLYDTLPDWFTINLKNEMVQI